MPIYYLDKEGNIRNPEQKNKTDQLRKHYAVVINVAYLKTKTAKKVVT